MEPGIGLTVKRGLRQKELCTWCRDAQRLGEYLNREKKELIRLADVPGEIDALDWVGTSGCYDRE